MLSLLEEGDQEVDRHHDVDLKLFVGHGGVADGAGQAGNFLKLELN